MTGWASKASRWANHARAYGKAHYLSNGQPLCAEVINNDGLPAIGRFRVEWGPLQTGDEKCKRCLRVLSRRVVAIPIYPMKGELNRRQG